MLKALALAVLPALAVAACSSSSGTGSSSSDGKAADSVAVKAVNSRAAVVVGATLSLSGSLDAYGPPLVQVQPLASGATFEVPAGGLK